MQRKLHLTKRCLKLAVTLFACPLFISSPSSALSAYDNLVQPVEQVFVGNSIACPQTHDLTTSWYSVLFNDSIPYTAPNISHRTIVREAVNNALDNGVGLAVGQTKDGDTGYVSILATAYGFTSSINFTTLSDGSQAIRMSNAVGAQITWSDVGGGVCNFSISFTGSKGNREVAFNMYSGAYTRQPMYINNPITYPVGYAGNSIPTFNQSADVDGDGLSAELELRQNTLDLKVDTDGDGLNDYIESQWYPDRENVFCGILQCAYPNPLTKDVYVEVDWMKNSSNNNVYKPSLTQISLVENMFDDKDINLHVDTGQFGGGNELSVYTQALSYTAAPNHVDFWDYKSGGDGITANFATDRISIWRYMIYGYNYLEKPASTGWAETMGDDLFISLGLIETISGIISHDRAVAGTMAHEIGHSLCLSDDKFYEEQPDECVYGGIDNDDENDSEYNLENYESVMNYRYQLTNHDDLGVVDYSDGSYGAGDHDDWGATALGMHGFSGTRTVLGAEEIASNYYITPDGSVIVEEATIEEMTGEPTRNQDESRDDPLMNTFSKPDTNDSDVEVAVDEAGRSTLPDRILLIVVSGIVAIFAMVGVLLYLKKK